MKLTLTLIPLKAIKTISGCFFSSFTSISPPSYQLAGYKKKKQEEENERGKNI
jgi:hypothetical protein